MKRKRVLGIVVIICALLVLVSTLLVGCGPSKVSWNIPTTFGSYDLWMAKLYVELADRVGQRTEGNFDIHIALGDELGIGSGEFLGALAENSVQGAELASGHQAGTIPHLGVFSLPFIMSTHEQAIAVGKAVRPISDREFEKLGVKIIAEYAVPGVHLWSKVPVDDVSDLKGLKVRAWDEASANAIKALGGVPVIMGSYEVYEAIQRGVVEAGVTSTGAAVAASWDEVCDYGYFMYLMFPYVYMGVSQEAFDNLPKDYQNILLEEAQRIEGRFAEEFVAADKGSNEEWIARGNELIEPSTEQIDRVKAKVLPLWDEWVTKAGSTGQEALATAKKALGL